jgi:cohesin loading factor subunit SCC2
LRLYFLISEPIQISATSIKQWATNGEGQNLVSILRNGLEAAAIVLFIVNTPNIDRRVLSEDAIKGVITLMRLNLSRHLLPALNQAGHYLSDASNKKDPQESPASKRRRVCTISDGTFVNGKDLKNIYKRIVATVDLQLMLMERIEGVVRLISLDDQQVLMVTSGVLPTFEIDINAASMSYSHDVFQVQQLQTTSISILTAAFRKYPMHREIILEDLFPVMLNRPSSKRSLRTFPIRYSSSPSTILQVKNTDIVGSLLSNGIAPHNIQMITALVLSLVHSCVLRPHFTGKGSSNVDDGIETATEESLQSGLRSCIVVADTFVRFLLKKCTKSKGDSMSDYRPVLINIIEDLLMVLIVPEYPAAEILLVAFQRRLNQDITLSSPLFCSSTNQQTQSSPDITYLNCAVDVLGKICSVQARLLAYTEANPIRLVPDAQTSHTYNSEQDMDCYCKSQHTDVLRIQCDQCNSLFHGPCVGVPDNESTPDEWYCDSCTLGRIVKREQQRLNVPDVDVAIFDQAYAMRYMFQSMLSQQMRSIDDKMVDPVKIHLARWIDEIESKRNSISDTSNKELYPARLLLSKLFEYWDTNYGPNGESLSDEGIIRVTICLMTKTSPFILTFRKQVELHLKHMSDDNPQILRKLSLKVIEKVCGEIYIKKYHFTVNYLTPRLLFHISIQCLEGDQTLMLLPIIKKAVSKRLSDESISVREAAVSLVGNYIARSPVAIRSYHSVLLPCLTDPGVSVRKRTVKIFQSILTKNPYYQGRTEVFCILVNRSIDPKEEESVRDLIDEVLYNLWFLSGTIPMSQHRPSAIELHSQVVSIPGVVTPNTPIQPVRRSPVQSRSDVTAEQMMEVVQIGNTYNSLESVLVKLLKGESSSLDNSGRKISEPMKGFELDGKECCRIVDSLCELLVVIDEQRDIRPHVGRDISSTLKTIAMFSSISPTSVVKHFDAIIPYLKADNGVSMDDESAIVSALCDILYRLAPSLDQHIINGKISISIATDLTKISYKFGPAVIVSAIRAFSGLANQSSVKGPSIFAEKLLALSKTFYGYALKKNDIDDFTSINVSLDWYFVLYTFAYVF